MKKQIIRKTLCYLFTAAMLLGAAAPRGTAVYAADQPDPILSTYKKNGVTYFDAGSDHFSNYKEDYLCEMLGNTNSLLDGMNMSDLWLHTAAGIFYETRDRGNQEHAGIAAIAASDSTEINANNFYATRHAIQAYSSFQQAETDIKDHLAWDHKDHYANLATFGNKDRIAEYIRNTMMGNSGALNNYDSQGEPVLATVLTFAHKDVSSNSNEVDGLAARLSAAAVYFSDFEIVALFPEDQGNNYVTDVTTSPDSEVREIASNVKNKTGTAINASQELAHTHSVSAESSVEGSEEYSFSEGLKVGYTSGLEIQGLKNELNLEFEFTATEAFSRGWSETSGYTQEINASQTISLDLPPYTNVMLKQQSGTTKQTTTYNCPVGLKYKATVVFYWIGSSSLKTQLYDFGSDSRAELKKWAVDKPAGNNGYEIDFADLNSKYTESKKAEQLISKHVPMTSTGAKFTLTIKTVESEVTGLAPVYPLKKIKLAKPEGLSIGSNYSTLEYLRMPMSVGDHDYTSKFELEALNSLDYEYYGFSKSYGHWIVADEDGNPWAEAATCPLEINGKRFKAVRPGTCFLKYIIDDDTYTWSEDNPDDHFTTAEELEETAMVEIYISEEASTINIRGDYTGYVGGEPEPLEKDDGLSVIICDGDGKEIPDAAYVWEKQESDSRGIYMTEDGKFSFTKAGTFHVRAVCEELGITSEWKEITVNGRSFDVTFDPQNGSEPVVKSVSIGNTVTAPIVEPDQCSVFAGWFTDKACTEEAMLTAPINKEMTFYAGWTASHTLEKVDAVPADCENEGISSHYACTVCGKLFKDEAAATGLKPEDTVVAALSHDWDEWKTLKEAEEFADGLEQRVCKRDPSHTEKRAIPALGHQLVRTKRKAATCTEAGNIEYYTCSLCGAIFQDKKGTVELDDGDTVLNALGHDWTEWVITKEATEKKEGRQVSTCLNDTSHKKTEVIPVKKHVHVLVKTKKKAATCTSSGNILYYTCSGCGAIFADENAATEIAKVDTIIKATDHDWGEWEVVKKATASKKGKEVCYCRNNRAHQKARSTPKLVKPLKTNQFISLSGKAATSKTITLAWYKPEGTQRYVIYAGDCDDGYTDTIDVNAECRYLRIKKIGGESLKSGHYYRFLIVAYGTNAKGKEREIGRSADIYLITKNNKKIGNYSALTLKSPKALSLKVGSSTTVKAVQKKSNGVTVIDHREVKYFSSDRSVAIVGQKSGVVKAKAAGTCTIYCVSQNGLYKKVTVTVKKK